MRTTWADALERVRAEFARLTAELATMTEARDELADIAEAWVATGLKRDDEALAASLELDEIAKLADVGKVIA